MSNQDIRNGSVSMFLKEISIYFIFIIHLTSLPFHDLKAIKKKKKSEISFLLLFKQATMTLEA